MLHHLEVVGRAHSEALRFQELVGGFKFGEPRGELIFDRGDSSNHRFATRRVMGCREYGNGIHLLNDLARQRMQLVQILDFIAKHFNPYSELLVLRNDFNRVALHTELSAGEVDVVSFVLHPDELTDDVRARNPLAHLKSNHRLEILFGRTEAVNARHGGHHDDVSPRQERVCS